MTLYFVTGNRGKFTEVQSVLGDVRQLDVDLPEIQDLEAQNVIREKLTAARHHTASALLVEDTSLYLRCLNGLPGPLIKWFLQALGDEGLYDLARKMGEAQAEAKTVLGYADTRGAVHFFTGTLAGRIVAPRRAAGFGWDRVFQPDGADKTFAEMGAAEKNAISMRRAALEQFRRFYRSPNPLL